MGTSFGATIYGILGVDKRYLRLVNGCLEYHRPIITSTTQTNADITAAKACTYFSYTFLKLGIEETYSSHYPGFIYRFAGFENNATTGMTARRSLKPNWLMADRQNEQRTCLIPHERASRPLSSNVLLGFSCLCVFEKWASQFGTALLLRIKNILAALSQKLCFWYAPSEVKLILIRICRIISVIQKIIMGSGQFLR